jgi:precorrin-8X/cobalt-precorrin-8 methylmutase
LTSTKPVLSAGLGTWRSVEEVLRSRGRHPFSSWQLTGAGAVGSQSLLGIPRLQQLRRTLGDRVEVWPFTTGLCAPRIDPGRIVVAEVWPSMAPVDAADGPVRDAAQVVGTARWLAEADRDHRLAPLFAPALARDVADAVVAEEGWVLGVVA